MGRVSISEIYDDSYVQESYETIYEYTYCDKCGSFDIRHTSKIHENIHSALLILTIGSCFGTLILLPLSQFELAGMIALISVVSFLLFGHFIGPEKCMKCGNTYFASGNVLNYPSDESVFDVPKIRTLRRKTMTKTL